MEQAGHLLRDVRDEGGGLWSGSAFVPCWGRDLCIWLQADGPGPTPRQLRILRDILAYTSDLRPSFEWAVFDHYRTNVLGSAVFIDGDGRDVTEERTPRLDDPGAIWGLLSGDSLWITEPDDPDQGDGGPTVEFTLTFECSWTRSTGSG